MEIRRFVPGEEAALSRLAARTLLEYNSKHTAPEEEPWIPLLVEKYRPEAILGFSETGHTYVLCDGEAFLGMGGVRKTGEDECLIYGLFLTPEAIGKGYGTMLFHALEADELYTQCSRAWLIPTTASQSTGAVKPGPTAMTTGAISRVVPKLRLAKIASTTAAGFSSSSILA